ncbi:hypothetical protein KIN20_013432 [Parelaphostrongylus tenuis]|uniref:Uncharacterized protein n=1 Tax=Parelaphostrongylus tenuis TaxID=148309 RepID=A0AAD5QNI5_PARTN|nr:hypothetical protein KIN20_013432 [Parelaphostrongylus tenuis]
MLDYVSNILWFPRLVSESLNYGRAGSEFCENGRDLSGDRQESPMIDAILRLRMKTFFFFTRKSSFGGSGSVAIKIIRFAL